MKIKRLCAILTCFVFLFCTACVGDKSAIPPEDAEWNDGETVATSKVSAETLYNNFLKERFSSYVSIDDKTDSVFRVPPQFNLASQLYAFYDVNKDGTQELLCFLNSENENKLYSMYTVSNGTVKEISINKTMFNKTYFPVLMSDGTLRATVGLGHEPGYVYLHFINGGFEISDLLTTPCDTAEYIQGNYEHIHYDDTVYTNGWSDSGRTIEAITAEEFERRVAKLNGNAVPVKLDVKSLLSFGKANDLPIQWLDEPKNITVSFTLPKDAPLPQSAGLSDKYNSTLHNEQERYNKQINAVNDPSKPFDTKMPKKPYYALYDLDGNGDDELFFGKENEDGKIIITCWYNENTKTYIESFGSKEAVNTKVLSNGIVLAEYVISDGDSQGRVLKYNGIASKRPDGSGDGYYYLNMALWTYGQEAAIYNYSNAMSRLPDSVLPETCERQRAALEKNAATVELDWQPLKNYV